MAVTHTINGDNADYANVGPEIGISVAGGGPFVPTSHLGRSSLRTWCRQPGSVEFGPPHLPGRCTGGARAGDRRLHGHQGATERVGRCALVLSVNPSLTVPAAQRACQQRAPAPAGRFCATAQPARRRTAGRRPASRLPQPSLRSPPPSGGGGGDGGGAVPWGICSCLAYSPSPRAYAPSAFRICLARKAPARFPTAAPNRWACGTVGIEPAAKRGSASGLLEQNLDPAAGERAPAAAQA